ncbi:hypothetical protein HD806DRAFT_514861 [Xylariaceae sp. AK1471]|nr:hypothetical protein HD806DRAFT_514861 [Xylariaceae sp. AK1471]
MQMSTRNRVCDRCIRKKVKCDLQRPHCSRCSEVGLPCTYSAERKKPGPSRGSRRQKHVTAPAGSASNDAQYTPNDQDDTFPAPGQGSLAHLDPEITSPEVIEGFCPSQVEMHDFRGFNLHDLTYGPTATVVHSNSQNIYPGYSLSSEHERELLVHFFNEVHPAIPLFRIEHFLTKYDDGLVERSLLVTMVTVAAKVLGPVSFWNAENVEICMRFLLEAMLPETATPDTHNSLDSFRLECLLAYYQFHQFPGSSSWMRISRLARRAYSVGIHQIDNPELCSAFDNTMATEDEIEDWRYLFWCIYCLDSYSNITVGTPFIVELESINTALVRKPHVEDRSLPASVPKVFLPGDVGCIWKTAKDVVSNGIMVNYNLHMITTTILRQAGYIMRLQTEGKRLPTKTAALKGALAALRLSLPPRYLNPTRNVLSGESCPDHHARLTNILHLYMAHLIITIPQRLEKNEEEFKQSWQESLEPCQNIVSVVEQWDNQHSPRIDPAICFIVFSALCFLELHRRSAISPTASLIASLNQGHNLLLLFLEHFSSMWAVPRFLIQQFRKAQNKSNDTQLTYAEVDWLLSKFKTPLHPKALPLFSTNVSTTVPDMNGNADMTMHLENLWSFDMYDMDL